MRAHEQVIAWVEQELAAGRLRLGDRLPAERALADQLGLARTAVREGMRVLEALGLVQSGVGSGPSAGTVVIARPGEGIGSALRLHLATDHLGTADVVAARILLEGWVGRSVPADAEELDAVTELLDAMDSDALSVEEFLALDAELHIRLARAAGNPVIAAMMTALREGIRGYTLEHARALRDWPRVRARLRAEHRAVVERIRASAPEDAAALLAAHIDGYYRSA